MALTEDDISFENFWDKLEEIDNKRKEIIKARKSVICNGEKRIANGNAKLTTDVKWNRKDKTYDYDGQRCRDMYNLADMTEGDILRTVNPYAYGIDVDGVHNEYA